MRPYEDIAATLRARGTRARRMQAVVDALWDGLHEHGVSWVGFYLADGPDAMVLGPSRDKPACSPIGLHGVCGQAFTTGRTRIVRDVAELGDAYIACDPRDRSEIVVPLFEASRSACWGVLDVDSHELGAFDEDDERGLLAVLRAASL